MEFIGGCSSYIGAVRDVNQDAVVYRSAGRGEKSFIVLAVCDGIGGLEHGELASSMVNSEIDKWYDEVLGWIDIVTVEPAVLYAHLKDAAENWNRTICDYKEKEHIATGTTMSLLMIIRDCYYIIQVGDSRIYLYSGGGLNQLTFDASVSRLKNGRMKTYLDNFMGKNRELRFTSVQGSIKEGDLFVVCSDGLYHRLLREDIENIYDALLEPKKVGGVCDNLINTMVERGETDNISVGIVRVSGKKKRSFFKL
ncbi:MAG: serine/threonine-protein phosphatase [Lachnospiraceae bacterium]|nr:serine/threonine-protein phosphatase [Lachnospiraceae bacterium]